jgi:hypothetical protein
MITRAATWSKADLQRLTLNACRPGRHPWHGKIYVATLTMAGADANQSLAIKSDRLINVHSQGGVCTLRLAPSIPKRTPKDFRDRQ